MSQEQLAHEAAVDRSLISKIECGQVVPSVETLVHIANALKVDANYLLKDSLIVSDVCQRDDVPMELKGVENEMFAQAMNAIEKILRKFFMR